MDLTQLYRHPLALLTDLYQLTMACGYWKLGRTDTQAVFHLHYRRNPFDGGYALACGLEAVISFLQTLHFDPGDLDYLAGLTGNDGKALFAQGFLDWLGGLAFTCDVDAVEEGTPVFPYEPLVRVRGPLPQCQLIETALLTLVNFPTLIATKAARICQAARGESVLEFGLRRAQGPDGGLTASRAAYVGGCAATSNVLAGKLFGIPVRGTHAHSWIMSFDDELESFQAYAQAMPNNAVFLVDTYDTIEGVRHAAAAGRWLRDHGHDLAGVRLDSGDLAWLSRQARQILDQAGFPDARILASNDLDEHLIESLKQQGAAITVWGVGTRLATAYDQPALGGVYKLSAIEDAPGHWRFPIKLSEQRAKSTIPGILQVRRYRAGDEYVGDAIYDELDGPPASRRIIDPLDLTRQKVVPDDATFDDLLVPVFRQGRCVYRPPALDLVRRRAADQLALLHAGIKRFLNPHAYPAGLDERLNDRRLRLITEAREGGQRP